MSACAAKVNARGMLACCVVVCVCVCLGFVCAYVIWLCPDMLASLCVPARGPTLLLRVLKTHGAYALVGVVLLTPALIQSAGPAST